MNAANTLRRHEKLATHFNPEGVGGLIGLRNNLSGEFRDFPSLD
jgi:hypothetical protein